MVEVRLHVAIAHARSVSEAAGGLHRFVREHPIVEQARVEALGERLFGRQFLTQEKELARHASADDPGPEPGRSEIAAGPDAVEGGAKSRAPCAHPQVASAGGDGSYPAGRPVDYNT